MTLIKILFSIAIVVTLSHCGLPSSSIPQDHYYRLANIVVSQPVSSQFKHIVVKPVKTAGIYNERAILYRQVLSPLEIHRYNYHFWAQTPAQMIHRYVLQFLPASSEFSSEKGNNKNKPPDLVIQIEVLRFERVLEDDTAYAEIALKIDAGHLSKLYQAKIKARKTPFYASVNAFAEGMNNIMQQLFNDLSKEIIASAANKNND